MRVDFPVEEYGTVMVGLLAEEAATMGKAKGHITPKVKFQVVLEALMGDKTLGQIAKAYGVHPISVGLWKKTFLERGAEIFAGDSAKQDYERRIAELYFPCLSKSGGRDALRCSLLSAPTLWRLEAVRATPQI